MSQKPRDPKAKPDALDPKSTEDKINEVQDVIDSAREHLDQLDERGEERARRDEEE